MRKEIICLRQIASGTQSCQAPQRVRGWGVEVGLPTLFLITEVNHLAVWIHILKILFSCFQRDFHVQNVGAPLFFIVCFIFEAYR